MVTTANSFNNYAVMEWATICTCFYGLGEITSPSDTSSDPNVHLSFADPKIVTLTIKQSEKDQFRAGAHVCLARLDNDLCPVTSILS